MSKILIVKPENLRIGDQLVADDSVFVMEVVTDSDGTWVCYSDGDEGYQSNAIRIFRSNDD